MGFQNSVEENIMGGGMGLGFGGGSGCGLIIIVLLILFVLFKDGGRGHDGGYGAIPYPAYGGGCGPCVQPTYKDESNWEQDFHICKELGVVDKDVIEQGCKDREVAHCEGEKTRALIEQNYIQDLRDRLAEKNDVVMTLKQEMFTEKKFDQLAQAIACTNNNIDKMFCKTDGMISSLACELPKRPPVYAESITPNTHHIDCDRGYDNYPRRGYVDDCCGCSY